MGGNGLPFSFLAGPQPACSGDYTALIWARAAQRPKLRAAETRCFNSVTLKLACVSEPPGRFVKTESWVPTRGVSG